MATLAKIAAASIPALPNNDLPDANLSLCFDMPEPSQTLFNLRLIAANGAGRQLHPLRRRTHTDMASLFALPVGLTLFEKGFDRLFRIVAANTRNLQRRFLGYRIPQIVRCTKGERLFCIAKA